MLNYHNDIICPMILDNTQQRQYYIEVISSGKLIDIDIITLLLIDQVKSVSMMVL